MSTVYSCKFKLMIMSLLMILILLITWTAAPLSYSRAVLAEVTVAGEVVMTLAALASLMMIALGASGMDGALRNQAAATGTQPLTYVGQLLNRWLTNSASNMGFSVFAQKMQQGLSYLPDGTLYLDSVATAAVADFQRWAWDEEGGNLEQFATVVPGNDLTADGFVIDRPNFELQESTYFRTQKSLYTVGLSYYPAVDVRGVTLYLAAMQSSSGTGVEFWYYAPSGIGVRDYAVLLMTTSGTYLGTAGTGTVVFDRWTMFNSISSNVTSDFYINPYRSVIPDISEFTSGGSVVGDPETFVGPMQQAQGTQLPLANTVTVSADAAARLHLDNYLRAVAAAYAGTGTASVPVTDVGTGDEDTLPLSVPLDTPIGVTGVSDTAIDQSGSVAGSDAVASDFEGLDDYTMDLTQFFPFCVPFDLAYLFGKLRADPEALVIDWHFMIPALDVDIPVQIDLSPFDSIAQLLRSLEVIAFIVALLVGTKNLIQGGD